MHSYVLRSVARMADGRMLATKIKKVGIVAKDETFSNFGALVGDTSRNEVAL